MKIQSSFSVNVKQILLFGRRGYILIFGIFFGQISVPREWKIVQI